MIDENKSIRFLFLGKGQIEYKICELLNIHQQATLVNNITKAVNLLKNNKYDVFVVNEFFLNNNTEFLNYSKNIFTVELSTSTKIKNNLIDCYLKPDETFYSKLLINILKHYFKRKNIVDALKFEMIGSSKDIKNLKEHVLNLKDNRSNVLITGESGTGKELVARMLNKSNSSKRPFIVINCCSIPHSLFESELFGYTKGSFTGAVDNKKGIFELADGGDLFLDEISELPLTMQAKLLRVLQDGEFFKIGSTKNIKSNFRLITATNKNLEEMVRSKKFREDLYFRINVLNLKTTPLRIRTSDICELFKYFYLTQLIKNNGDKSKYNFTKTFIKKLRNNLWSGNIRELKNFVERKIANIKTSDDFDLMNHFSTINQISYPANISEITKENYNAYLKHTQKLYYDRALQMLDGDINSLASRMKMGRSTIFRHIKRLEITY